MALPELWEAAREHDDVEALRELAISLLQSKGLVWDSQLRAITTIIPHEEYIPSLRLALKDWQWDGVRFIALEPVADQAPQIRVAEGKRVKTKIRREQSLSRYRLTPIQQQEVRKLLAEGLSVRDVAKRFGVSHSAVWRTAHRQAADSLMLPPPCYKTLFHHNAVAPVRL